MRIGRASSTALKQHLGDVEILARSIIEKGPQEAREAADWAASTISVDRQRLFAFATHRQADSLFSVYLIVQSHALADDGSAQRSGTG